MTTYETIEEMPYCLSCIIRLPHRPPVQVNIHDTQDLMMARCSSSKVPILANCRHFFLSISKKPALLEMNFFRDHIGAGVVAHEAFHAALQMSRWRGVEVLTGRTEETVAIDLERIVKAFWGWWHDETKTTDIIHYT